MTARYNRPAHRAGLPRLARRDGVDSICLHPPGPGETPLTPLQVQEHIPEGLSSLTSPERIPAPPGWTVNDSGIDHAIVKDTHVPESGRLFHHDPVPKVPQRTRENVCDDPVSLVSLRLQVNARAGNQRQVRHFARDLAPKGQTDRLQIRQRSLRGADLFRRLRLRLRHAH